MPRTPSAFPFSGRLRRRAINPTPPKRVKAWGRRPPEARGDVSSGGRCWLLIWGDNNWWTQRNTKNRSFVYACREYSTSWQDSLIRGFFYSFFLLTRQRHSSFFSSFHLETRSTRIIQLPFSRILCRGLKIRVNILFVTCLVYVDVCCWRYRLFVSWVRLRRLSILGKETGKDPDTLGYTTHFWREFEIEEKKVLYVIALKDID